MKHNRLRLFSRNEVQCDNKTVSVEHNNYN